MIKKFLLDSSPLEVTTLPAQKGFVSHQKADADSISLAIRQFQIQGQHFEVQTADRNWEGSFVCVGDEIFLSLQGRTFHFKPPARSGQLGGSGAYKSPLPGRVIAILVEEGQLVEAGQTLILVEAMKMENAIKADRAGRISELSASVGQIVNQEQILVRLDAEEPGRTRSL